MEEDIQNYSPTVMFRGTPCTINNFFQRPRNLQACRTEFSFCQMYGSIYFPVISTHLYTVFFEGEKGFIVYHPQGAFLPFSTSSYQIHNILHKKCLQIIKIYPSISIYKYVYMSGSLSPSVQCIELCVLDYESCTLFRTILCRFIIL